MDTLHLLKKFDIKPSAQLGQNFLVNEIILDDIVDAAAIAPTDQVLEIGPGVGNLTARLAERAKFLLSVEKDPRFFPLIKEQLGDRLRRFSSTPKSSANVELIIDDILRFNFQELIEPGYVVVANIPYYITGKIIELLLAAKVRPKRIVLLMQKEVAERAVAGPGDLSILGISVQLYADAKLALHVPKEDFYPVPKVDSALLVLDVLPEPRFPVEEKKFFRIVKSLFAGKRKQIRNTLKNNLKLTAAQLKALEESGIVDLNLRPQDLSLDIWYKIYCFAIEKLGLVL